MKKLLAVLAAGSLLIPTFASADGGGHGRHGKRGGAHGYSSGYYGGHGQYGRYYPYQSYGRYYGHHDDDDSDEALWAVGGLVLGTIIGSAATRNAAAASQVSAPLPPPQKRKVVTCYDEVAYDEKGDPYVARQCSETWR